MPRRRQKADPLPVSDDPVAIAREIQRLLRESERDIAALIAELALPKLSADHPQPDLFARAS